MNISEAHDLNEVLRWIIDQPRPGVPVSSEKAKQAAARLADRCRARLMAGVNGDEVNDGWPATLDHPDFWRALTLQALIDTLDAVLPDDVHGDDRDRAASAILDLLTAGGTRG